MKKHSSGKISSQGLPGQPAAFPTSRLGLWTQWAFIFLFVAAFAGVVWHAYRQTPFLKVPFLVNLRDNLLLAIELFALLLMFCILLAVFRWFFRKPEGTSFLPFDIVADKNSNFDGKSIAAALSAEMARIYRVHQVPIKDKENAPGRHAVYAASQQQIVLSKKNPNPMTVTTDAGGMQETRFDFRSDPVAGEVLRPELADAVVIGVGGSSVSLMKLVAVFKQLWSNRDPLYIISGSFHQFGKEHGLVARIQRKGDRTLVCKMTQVAEGDGDIAGLIQDLAFKIYQEMSVSWTANSATKTWQGLKYYTEALVTYQEYTLSGVDENLRAVHKASLQTAQTEKGNARLFAFCVELAEQYFSKGQYRYSEEILQCAIGIYQSRPSSADFPPRDVADAYNGLGASQMNLGKFYDAEDAYRRSLSLDPENLDVYVNLSLVLANLRYIPSARRKIAKAMELGLLKNRPAEEVANWYASIGESADAVGLYEKAIAGNPRHAPLYYQLANLYARIGEVGQAIPLYQKAIQLEAKNAYILNDLALAQDAAGDPDAALISYKASIDKDPSFAAPHNNLALFHARHMQWEDAFLEYGKAIDIDSTVPLFYRNSSILHRKRGELDKAIREARKAISLEPASAIFHFELAAIYTSMDFAQEAIREYGIAIDLNPYAPEARNALGMQYVFLGKENEAMEQFNLSNAITPNAYAFLGIAGWKARNDSEQEAYRFYAEAYHLASNDPVIVASLAASFLRLGNEEKYREYAAKTRACHGYPDPGEYNSACFLALIGDADAAIPLLATALELGQQTRNYARRDPDFAFIRNLPAFVRLVEE